MCTVEAMPLDLQVDFLAVDEVQLAADRERGHVFTDRILHARGPARDVADRRRDGPAAPPASSCPDAAFTDAAAPVDPALRRAEAPRQAAARARR